MSMHRVAGRAFWALALFLFSVAGVLAAEQADMILAVQKRGSEDVLAVYDPTFNQSSTYLWRAMGRGGLDQNELPIFGYFRVAVENASK